jgi:hypothetical protein
MVLLVTQSSQGTEDLAAAGVAVLGQIAIPGRGEHVRVARAFVARVLAGLGTAGRPRDTAGQTTPAAALDAGTWKRGTAPLDTVSLDTVSLDTAPLDTASPGTGTLDTDALDTAVLLTSELVTNAIRHSRSGTPGGAVSIAVLAVAAGIRVEVIDAGSGRETPVVKDDVYTCDGHGLFLVEALADGWGYECGPAGTTVWFGLGRASRTTG